MSNFIKKISIERNAITDANKKFGEPYLNGLTVESINKWNNENKKAKLSYVKLLKELAFLTLSWADKSRVPFEEEINQEKIDKKLSEICNYDESGR